MQTNATINPVKMYLLEYTDARRSLVAHVREWENQQRNMDRIGDLYERATKATSSTEALRVSGTTSRSKIEDAVLEIVRLKEQLGMRVKEGAPFDALMQDALRLSNECEARLNLINRLRGERARHVLFLRYVCGMGWDAIERQTDIPIRTLFRVHGKALRFLNQYYTPQKV